MNTGSNQMTVNEFIWRNVACTNSKWCHAMLNVIYISYRCINILNKHPSKFSKNQLKVKNVASHPYQTEKTYQ